LIFVDFQITTEVLIHKNVQLLSNNLIYFFVSIKQTNLFGCLFRKLISKYQDGIKNLIYQYQTKRDYFASFLTPPLPKMFS
jgi:hypothetical protein